MSRAAASGSSRSDSSGGRSTTIIPSTPAAAASSQNRSGPYDRIGLRYPINTTGVVSSSRRNARTMSSTRATFTPACRPRLAAAWMIGPSAIGSVKGMPISIRSAPAAGMPRNNAIDEASSGSQASRNGINAPRPSRFSAANRLAMRLMPRLLG